MKIVRERKRLLLRINRNIVECKSVLRLLPKLLVSELIETLWNVNPVKACEEYYVNLELIETLWNVNCFIDLCNSGTETRINRNIVECK